MTGVAADALTFGRYEIIEGLGRGGMGEVALAVDRGLGEHDDKLVALKVLREDFAEDEAAVEAFLHEARIVARLAHQNIVGMYRLGEHQGRYFISMEYIRGGSLAELRRATKREGPVPLDAAISAVVQLCRGAHAAHELCADGRFLGIVHRDITPHNAMVDVRGVCKLLDFGIAIGSDDVGANTSSGKPSYLSPEQANAEGVDRRTDVYGLGVVLWELLAGRQRIKFEDRQDTLRAVREGLAPSLAEHRPDLPPLVIAAINRALAVNRDDRFDTAADFADALRDAVGDLEIGEAALAKVVSSHLSARIAARAQARLEVEGTMVPASQRTGASSTSSSSWSSTVSPTGAAPLGAADPSVLPTLPGFAVGATFEICTDGDIATVRTWARPDLSRDEGAENAAMIVGHTVALISEPRDGGKLRGLILDCRTIQGAIGTKTIGLIELFFSTAETHQVSLAILVSRDPIHRLDFTDLVGRTAPRHGIVADTVADAVAWARRESKGP